MLQNLETLTYFFNLIFIYSFCHSHNLHVKYIVTQSDRLEGNIVVSG